jgi:hypothetical protein
MNALHKQFKKMLQGGMKHRTFIADLAKRRAALDRIANNSGIYEHPYNDITAEMNEAFNNKPEWSLIEFFLLSYPDETAIM